MTMDEMQAVLAELLDELPEAFFEELNGGVSLHPDCKRNPAAVGLFILGEYIVDGLGRRIALYYGSFMELFGGLSRLQIRRELRKTLRHEFRHHLEGLAGLDDLALEDARDLRRYREADAAQSRGEADSARERGRREGRGFLRRGK